MGKGLAYSGLGFVGLRVCRVYGLRGFWVWGFRVKLAKGYSVTIRIVV